VTCNASAERILGLSLDQMAGSTSTDPMWRAVHEDGSAFPGEDHPIVTTLKTGEAQHNVTMGVHKPDGSLTWMAINTEAFARIPRVPDRVRTPTRTSTRSGPTTPRSWRR
jgi:PAS domain-containing protein